ncbi:hypothetical protein MTR_6g065440 [Medicago truncatula]|uniref:Uncharacterized protein n=1 Tax=Medicago truncatula TaxID=3880 RepID=G7KP84_MEDTR|nr:hypothetical protein MTR_6g065440 [Medicago truncatula]
MAMFLKVFTSMNLRSTHHSLPLGSSTNKKPCQRLPYQGILLNISYVTSSVLTTKVYSLSVSFR